MIKDFLKIPLTTLLLCLAASANAQTRHSIVGGVGMSDIMDTYLSPYSYKGINIHVQRETNRTVQSLGVSDVNFQTFLDIDGSALENPGGNVNEYAGGIRYAMGWTKTLFNVDLQKSDIDIQVGPMASGYAGCVYNERNGNNPAQAKVDLMIDLTAKANWNFRWLNKDMSLSYQMILPFVGMAFSPNYGQSYYEAFDKGNYDHNAVFANFVNMPSLRHIVNFEIPLRKGSQTTLRIGYLGYFMQSKFNNLRYHSYTNSFVVGITKVFKRL